jgi:hypothetical protein
MNDPYVIDVTRDTSYLNNMNRDGEEMERRCCSIVGPQCQWRERKARRVLRVVGWKEEREVALAAIDPDGIP